MKNDTLLKTESGIFLGWIILEENEDHVSITIQRCKTPEPIGKKKDNYVNVKYELNVKMDYDKVTLTKDSINTEYKIIDNVR